MKLWKKYGFYSVVAALAMCISASGFAQAQSEALSRQISALKSAMGSFQSHVNTEIQNVKNEMRDIGDEMKDMKTCANKNKIYAPGHSDADKDGCRPDDRLQCTTVSWHGGRPSPGSPINDVGLEFPREGGERFMVSSDTASVAQRCKERGYEFGFPIKIFTHKEWCRYSNANMKAYRGSSNKSGEHNDIAQWYNVSCSNPTSYAKCCK